MFWVIYITKWKSTFVLYKTVLSDWVPFFSLYSRSDTSHLLHNPGNLAKKSKNLAEEVLSGKNKSTCRKYRCCFAAAAVSRFCYTFWNGKYYTNKNVVYTKFVDVALIWINGFSSIAGICTSYGSKWTSNDIWKIVTLHFVIKTYFFKGILLSKVYQLGFRQKYIECTTCWW